ncbi:hypothetical protein A3I34_02215 [Candidatus Jorgensenbacteria bacterium RIFCSPLOWO2_02_FULL_45_12]|uniref:Uncharacterized protein n=1 Tax=Candidatus Jorgensenbacteria bacterium RIFCSPHIGHO2_02_FULL_45_20 TaxID=1798470 RepID=A0A1F6BPM1_9BACT|nr:MAG: hypothetical protein A3D55_01115 [Candidatus Jorgensenbacteria bacterium RIFCSPHIGHO2_02_FULL_45_20]OGG42178.1 MAG: hypothetical protein A3I34_02215 [Candidatus Jorgensenbacteria bacterium RIFCSPLOWO2_02_FULL_45_12]
MKKALVFVLIFILAFAAGVLLILKFWETPREAPEAGTFKGPVGAPYVRGPSAPPPASPTN